MAVSADILQVYNASRQCVDKGCICHAPENSLYFGRDGLVSACCYSRSSPLGRYPDQTIEAIWNSAQAKTMRAAMRRNELPSGCDLCADQFYARNFSGFLAHQFDSNARPPAPPGLLPRAKALLQPRKVKRYPARLEFELSNKCNLECSMCSGFFSSSIRTNRENLPALPQVYDRAFVQQLVPFLPHLTNAKFLGGEPFLVDLYYKIWDCLIEVNPECNVSVTTNGTVFTEKVKRVLQKLNCEVIISLDSVTKATYESIRKNASLDRTLRNLEAFSTVSRLKHKALTLAICPMTTNCREIPELVSFANERGMRVFFNTVVYPLAHSLKASPLTLKRELLDLYGSSNPEPRSEIERANREAVQGLCRQIQYWIKEDSSAARPPVHAVCSELLAIRKEFDSVACVLSDLAGNNAKAGSERVVYIEGVDPVRELKSYFHAVWEVGGMLQSAGLLSDLRFDGAERWVFLSYLESNVGAERARKIHLDTRRFAREILHFCGTLSAQKLIELFELHYPPSVKSGQAS